ncbi:alanine aminotransferase 2 [Halyomorpha halys]|uniref:alanine aminotransferase 2 n=1 Tax=Halyomorpha halys TaxID=286706 RepID=UPI0034D38E1A
MNKKAHFLTRPLYKSNRCFVSRKSLTLKNLNPNIKEMYMMDTDDPVFKKYKMLKERLKQCPESLPYDEILMGSSGCLHSSGYRPLTYLRQVASAALYPALLEDESFPDDVKCKVIQLRKHYPSVGSCTESPGLKMIRITMSNYLSRRDGGLARDHNNVILTAGSTDGVRNILRMMNGCIDGKSPAIVIPSPSYPYGLMEEMGYKQITYELDEENSWASTTENLERAIAEAKKKYALRALIITNPSNPTGTVLKQNESEQIVKFACKEKLVLIVDETYQRNIYEENKFQSMKKVMADMGKPYSEMEMVSVFSLSKDVLGEAATKAGLMELQNFNEDVMNQFEKCVATNFCSNSIGQVMMYAFADHPVEGDPSYDLWKEETESRFNSLARKAKMIVDELNKIEGFSCPPLEGGYFIYIKICVPEKAVEEGKRKCYKPSTFYAIKLLQETGVFVTPGDLS